jgi:hypothetical protein
MTLYPAVSVPFSSLNSMDNIIWIILYSSSSPFPSTRLPPPHLTRPAATIKTTTLVPPPSPSSPPLSRIAALVRAIYIYMIVLIKRQKFHPCITHAETIYLKFVLLVCPYSIQDENMIIHYRNSALCRVPNVLPSVFFRALGKKVLCRVFFPTLGKDNLKIIF